MVDKYTGWELPKAVLFKVMDAYNIWISLVKGLQGRSNVFSLLIYSLFLLAMYLYSRSA